MSISTELPRLVTPERALEHFTSSLQAAQVERAAACFSRDARLITADRTVVRGRPQIAALLAQLSDSQASLEFCETTLIEAEHVALLRGRCKTRSKGPDLFWLTQTMDLTAVLHLIEGDWKLAIFSPWESDHTTEIGE